MIGWALQATAAFNLVCAGTETIIPRNGQPSERPFTQTYRLDLREGRWCEADCTQTQQINRVLPTVISLYDTSNADNTIFGDAALNRETGQLNITSLNPAGARGVTANCRRAPFTGFPARRF